MSASRLIRERNARGNLAREAELVAKEKKGPEFRSPPAEVVRKLFARLTGGRR